MPTTEFYVYKQLTPEKDCKYCEKNGCKIGSKHRRMKRCWVCLFRFR